MKILLLGDVVSQGGRLALQKRLPGLKQKYRPDVVIINGENGAIGNGVDRATVEDLFALGAHVITGGNHSFHRKEAKELHEEQPFLLRPANWRGDPFGYGHCRVDLGAYDLRVISLQGTLYMNPCDNPFVVLDRLLEESTPRDITVVDFHAEATSEKQALGRYADGRVALVVGTHTHVQTNDPTLLPKGTGYLTDLGMCGAQHSILGKGLEPCVHNFVDPENRMKITDGPAPYMINGLVAEIDEKTKTCRGLKLINITEIN